MPVDETLALRTLRKRRETNIISVIRAGGAHLQRQRRIMIVSHSIGHHRS